MLLKTCIFTTHAGISLVVSVETEIIGSTQAVLKVTIKFREHICLSSAPFPVVIHYTAINCSLCSGVSQRGEVVIYYHLSADAKGKLVAIKQLHSNTLYNYTLTVFKTAQEQANKCFITNNTHGEV